MDLSESAQSKRHLPKGGLVREQAYLYEDEERARQERADEERCSKSEVIRRALRAYLKLSTPADG